MPLFALGAHFFLQSLSFFESCDVILKLSFVCVCISEGLVIWVLFCFVAGSDLNLGVWKSLFWDIPTWLSTWRGWC